MKRAVTNCNEGYAESMSTLMRVPIERNDKTLSWNAICPECKKCVFMVTDEAVAHGPRRESGSSQLLPVTMTARHDCDGKP